MDLGLHLVDLGLHLVDLGLHLVDLGLHLVDLGLHLVDLGLHLVDLGAANPHSRIQLFQSYFGSPQGVAHEMGHHFTCRGDLLGACDFLEDEYDMGRRSVTLRPFHHVRPRLAGGSLPVVRPWH